MSAMQKRDSENLAPENNLSAHDMPAMQKSASENKLSALASAAAAPELSKPAESSTSKRALARTSELLAAWGAGLFNEGEVSTAIAEFFTSDAVVDASAGGHALAEYKAYHGLDGVKDWFVFLAGFDYEGLEMTHVVGSQPNEVWQLGSAAQAVSKATGKGAAISNMIVYTWEGDMCSKIKLAAYQPARVAAILSKDDVPMPQMPQMPTFEPHPSPMEPYAEKMALWGAGEFNKKDTRSATMAKHMTADCVLDMADSALPDAFHSRTGLEGVSDWTDHVADTWEMTNLDIAPVVGLQPGCVVHRFACDVRHKTTGKEAKGVEIFVLLAYNSDGQFVFSRHYYGNAALLGSIYP